MFSHLCILYLDLDLFHQPPWQRINQCCLIFLYFLFVFVFVLSLHMYHLYLYLIYVAFQHQIIVHLILKLNISIPGQEQFPSDGARRSFSSKVNTQPMFLNHCWLLVTDMQILVKCKVEQDG